MNLKGNSKLAAIRDRIGQEPFDYIGNSANDLPIWAEARQALVATDDDALLNEVQELRNQTVSFPVREHKWIGLLRVSASD